MKKLLFAAYTLDLGGIETALVSLLNFLIKKYEVTLVLEKNQGIFLNELNEKIKVVEYRPNQNKNILIRKTINLLKRIGFIFKYKNKFDFAASFATYSKMASFCARTASKNSVLWVHSDYLNVFKNDKNKMIDFFQFISYDKFKEIVFVSKTSKDSFDYVFSKLANKTIVINNVIDYKKILEKSNEYIDVEKEDNTITFLNICRHTEESKKLTRLIEVARKLKEEKFNFRILAIGEGQDTDLYKDLVIKNNLQDVFIFLGIKENPYPYFKISDAVVLTSEYEGYPVVFIEAQILDLPVITTNISDAEQDINGKYGIVTSKKAEDIYVAMKKFIEKGYIIKEKFNPEEFNKKILNKIENLIDRS